MPIFSSYTTSRQPSAVRLAQLAFSKRTDWVDALNGAIWNVTLPMHPALQTRLQQLWNAPEFSSGIVKYAPTTWTTSCQQTFRHLIHTSTGCKESLHVCVTDGWSLAMELAILWVWGNSWTHSHPLLLLDPAYSNYKLIAERTGRSVIAVPRIQDDTGGFHLPDQETRETYISKYTPHALIIIPYDNPTGQALPASYMLMLAQLCVKYDIRFVSDEAYRELVYIPGNSSSIWSINESICPGISGRRVSIESASKVRNACWLRIGALVTDNAQLYGAITAEHTSNLWANVIGQYIFSWLLDQSAEQLTARYNQQRNYYLTLMTHCSVQLHTLLPWIIISPVQAALYSVINVKNLVPVEFSAQEFVLWCAQYGQHNGYTVLLAPLAWFFITPQPEATYQLRLSYVETPERLELLPEVFATLLHEYIAKNK